MAENINTYMGNAALGQGTAGGQGGYGPAQLTVSNDAVDKMMMYRFYENRDNWARQNVLADLDAKTAAEEMKFAIGDYLIEGDRKTVLSDIEEVTKIYAEDPTAVTIKMKDGKIINGEQYQKLHNAINKANGHIGAANARTNTAKLLEAQIATITDPDEYAKALAHKDAMYASPITESITTYPNLKVFDMHTVTGADFSPEIQSHLGDYFTNTQYTATDVKQGVATWSVAMQNSKNVNETLSGTINAWQEIQKNALASLGMTEEQMLDDPDFDKKYKAAVQAQKGGDTFLTFLNNHNDYADYFNSALADMGAHGAAYLGGMNDIKQINGTQPLTQEQGLEMLITTNAKKGFKQTVTQDPTAREWYNAGTSRKTADLAEKEYEEGKKTDEATADYLASAMQQTISSFIAPQVTKDATGKVQGSISGADAKKNINPTGIQIADNEQLVSVPINAAMQQMFKRTTGEKTTVRVQDDLGVWTTQVVSAGDYNAKEMYAVLDANGDPTGRVIMRYQNPKKTEDVYNPKSGKLISKGSTGMFSQGYNLENLYELAPNLYNDGTPKGQQMSQAAAIAMAKKRFGPQPGISDAPQGAGNGSKYPDLPPNEADRVKGKIYHLSDGTNRPWNGKKEDK